MSDNVGYMSIYTCPIRMLLYELLNIVPIIDFITAICNETFDTIVRDPEHHLCSVGPPVMH